MEHARRIANATGVHRHGDDLLFDPGCVTGISVIQQKSAPFASVFLAAIALLPLARRAMSDDIERQAGGQCRTCMIMTSLDWVEGCSDSRTLEGASRPTPLKHLPQLFDVDQCQTYIHTLRWQDRPLQCARCQAGRRPVGQYHPRPGANATGVTAASAPSTISPTPCSIRASGRSRSGCWRPFCCVSPARRDALPGRWGS